jgi:protein SCO1/2
VTLSEYKNIKKALGDKSTGIDYVFITVDPERDSQVHLQKYLKRFDPEFIGLSEDRSVLEQVWADYGVYQEQIETGSAIGYLVDHTSRTYVIDHEGNWKLTYPFGIETKKIIQDLKHMLENN